MENCTNCGSNCFEKPNNCIYHAGKSEGVVKQGSSQAIVNEELGKELNRVANKVDSCSFCSGGTSNSSSSDVSTNSVVNSNPIRCNVAGSFSETAKIKVETIPDANGVGVVYDLTDALPEGKVISSRTCVEGKVGGEDRILTESDSLRSSFSLKPNQFPATLDVSTRVMTDSGEKVITGRTPLDSNGKADTPIVEIKSIGRDATNFQSDVNKVFDDKLCSLESKVDSVYSSSLFAEIEALKLQVASLQTTLANVSNLKVTYQDNCDDCGGGTTTSTLGAALTSINQKACTNAAGVLENRSTGTSLTDRYNSIPVTLNALSGAYTTPGGTITYPNTTGGGGGGGSTDGNGGDDGGTTPTTITCPITITYYNRKNCGGNILSEVQSALTAEIGTIDPNFTLVWKSDRSGTISTPSVCPGMNFTVTCGENTSPLISALQTTVPTAVQSARDFVASNCECDVDTQDTDCGNFEDLYEIICIAPDKVSVVPTSAGYVVSWGGNKTGNPSYTQQSEFGNPDTIGFNDGHGDTIYLAFRVIRLSDSTVCGEGTDELNQVEFFANCTSGDGGGGENGCIYQNIPYVGNFNLSNGIVTMISEDGGDIAITGSGFTDLIQSGVPTEVPTWNPTVSATAYDPDNCFAPYFFEIHPNDLSTDLVPGEEPDCCAPGESCCQYSNGSYDCDDPATCAAGGGQAASDGDCC
jgi:hypothetical protein